MKNQDVIFLIESKSFNKESLRLSIEKLTKKKVFNFFSMEEAAMYIKLKPAAIIYSSENDLNKVRDKFPSKTNFIDISERINQEGKDFLVKHATISERLISLLNLNLN